LFPAPNGNRILLLSSSEFKKAGSKHIAAIVFKEDPGIVKDQYFGEWAQKGKPIKIQFG
jgi:hypothetical protein